MFEMCQIILISKELQSLKITISGLYTLNNIIIPHKKCWFKQNLFKKKELSYSCAYL